MGILHIHAYFMEKLPSSVNQYPFIAIILMHTHTSMHLCMHTHMDMHTHKHKHTQTHTDTPKDNIHMYMQW